VQASYWGKLALQPRVSVTTLLDCHVRRWGFFAPPPLLFFLLPIIHPLGKTLFLSPDFQCMKNSRWRLNFLQCELSLKKISPALQDNLDYVSTVKGTVYIAVWGPMLQHTLTTGKTESQIKNEKQKNMIIYCIKQHVSVHYNVLVMMSSHCPCPLPTNNTFKLWQAFLSTRSAVLYWRGNLTLCFK